MRKLSALVLAAVVFALLTPSLAGAREETSPAGEGTTLVAAPTPAFEIVEEAPSPPPSRAGEVLKGAFQGAARAGAREARPARPRTVNARNRWPDLNEPAPAPGVGRKIRVQAYSYHLRGFTARGTRTRMGTVAVDPRVIPLGSKLYIPGYGWGRAVDTGGAIQGRKIDVWFPTYGQCMQWGIRDVTITVLP